MSKWSRVILNQKSQVLEVITYDPVGVINEAFLPEYKPCPEEVERGYWYDPETETFYLPENYAKHPDFEHFGYVENFNHYPVDENGFIVFPPPPKVITEPDFRSKLTVLEKVMWDNPETGTLQQKSVINTMKLDFPFTGIETIRDELDLLESLEVIGVGRADEIYNSL